MNFQKQENKEEKNKMNKEVKKKEVVVEDVVVGTVGFYSFSPSVQQPLVSVVGHLPRDKGFSFTREI